MALQSLDIDDGLDELEDLPSANSSLADERLHRKQQLAIAFRIFGRLKFDEGIAGHISARDPEHPDRFWVNPFGVHFSRMKVSDLLLVDERGRIVEGTRKTNKAAFTIHSAIHDARPDVVAAAHAHSVHGRAWASLGRPLDPIIQESCAFWNDHVVYQEYNGLLVEREEMDLIAAKLGKCRAAILLHHGFLTVGGTVEEAAWWFITMDRAAQMQLLAEAAGTPRIMPDDEAAVAHRQFGNASMARHSFKVLADLVLEQEPDVLD